MDPFPASSRTRNFEGKSHFHLSPLRCQWGGPTCQGTRKHPYGAGPGLQPAARAAHARSRGQRDQGRGVGGASTDLLRALAQAQLRHGRHSPAIWPRPEHWGWRMGSLPATRACWRPCLWLQLCWPSPCPSTPRLSEEPFHGNLCLGNRYGLVETHILKASRNQKPHCPHGLYSDDNVLHPHQATWKPPLQVALETSRRGD